MIDIRDRLARTPMWLLVPLLLAALAGPAAAKDPSYIGTVHTAGTAADGATARGTVFLDADRDSTPDPGERGVAGVLVSNGREVVATGADGSYEIPAYDDMNLFITKPAGYAVPVSDEMVPRFAYIHKVAGSPPLRYGGIEPTGPLPREINFPLIEDPVGDRFRCLAFGDPPYNLRVHQRHRPGAPENPRDLLADLDVGVGDRHGRRSRRVRGDDYVVHLQEGVVGGSGLLLENIEPRAGDLPGLERLDQRRLVHHGPAASVDEVRRGLHRLEEALAYELPRTVVQGHQHRHEVRAACELLQAVDQLDPVLAGVPWRDERVV